MSVKIPRICENKLWAIVPLVTLFRENKIKDIWHICGAHEECKWRNGESGFKPDKWINHIYPLAQFKQSVFERTLCLF